MGKASKSKEEFSGRREKIAAQRAAAKRAEQRRNGLLIAGGAVIVVIAVVVAFVVVKANKHSSTTPPTAGASISGAPTGSNLTSVLSTISSVPTSATDAVGTGGSAVTKPQTITGSPAPLTSAGKPDMLYIGAEYCPYCAAERWAMIVALSRFGTFTGIQPMRSSASDVYANTPTWTFAHVTYTSKYVTFSPVEMYTNIPTSGGGYTTLQTPTAAQNALFAKYDAPPYVSSTQYSESYPFVDFGNKYLIVGSSYSPQVLDGLTWSQIASDLTNTSSPVAQGVNGTAHYMTAALCKLTNNQPATACTAKVQSLEPSL
jgi:hypothetical protein